MAIASDIRGTEYFFTSRSQGIGDPGREVKGPIIEAK
jgi:hypothetical protein